MQMLPRAWRTAPVQAIARPATPAPSQSSVPNFRGMSLRAVLVEAAARGLTIQPDGSGIARLQDPPAGAVLHAGERICIQFARLPRARKFLAFGSNNTLRP